LGQGFTDTTVADLSPDDVGQFADKWCRAVQVAACGEETDETRREAEQNAGALRAAIEANDRVAALAANPLLLTIIALVHGHRATLPEHRVDLYQECTDVLLGYWDTARHIPTTLSPAQNREILAPFALELHKTGMRDAPRSDVEPVIADGLAGAGADAGGAGEFLDYIRQRSGLLEERGLDRWGFVHQAFQEYLAAVALTHRDDAVEFLLQRRFDPWWREVTLLFAGLRDPSSLMRRLLAERKDIFQTNLLLAARCLGDSRTAEATLRAQVTEQIEHVYWETQLEPVRDDALDTLVALQDRAVLERAMQATGSDAAETRALAARALGVMGGEEVVEYLIPLLKDRDLRVCWRAADALGQIGSDQAVQLIIPLLKDPDFRVWWSAADALGKIGSDQAVQLIIPLLKDQDSHVRGSAADALGQIGSDQAVQLIIPLLEDQHSTVRGRAASALGEIGADQAVPLLIPLLEDQASYVRGRAAYAVGEIGAEEAVPHLIRLLKDQDSYVRSRAAYALGEIGAEQAVPHLIPLLKDQDSTVRGRAASALGEIGAEQALQHIIPLLKDEDAFVAGDAACALGQIGSDQAVQLVIPLLEDQDSTVRSSAAYALGKIGSDQAVQLIMPLLEDQDSTVRWSAAGALGSIGSENAVQYLIPLLKDEDSLVRFSAAEALGSIGSENAVQYLIPLLKDEHWLVRGGAAEALWQIRERAGLVVYEDGTVGRLDRVSGEVERGDPAGS